MNFYAIGGLVSASLVTVVGYAAMPYIPGTSPNTERVAMARLSSALYDADSAQYRNVRVTETGFVCGEINAKNKMGGYVGFTRFMDRKGMSAPFVDPMVEYTPQADDYAINACVEYGICEASNRRRAEYERQDSFNNAWVEACENG